MGEFNSDDHNIYYCGQESLRRNGVALTVNKSPQYSLKNYRVILVRFQSKPFNIIVIQVCAPTTYAKKVEIYQFYENLQYLLELTSKKDILFNIGGWNVKGGSQEIPEVQGSLALEYKMKQGKG